MKFIDFRWRSLKTRVTLFTLAIFLVSLWSLAFNASRMLLTDMERVLGEQQFATVSLLAADVNDELESRLQALKDVAGQMSPALLGNPAALQAFLEDRLVLKSLFNGGVIGMGIDGIVVADVPFSAGRIGINYMDIDGIAAALKEGRSSISQPVMGKKLRAPVLGITAPIRDPQGKVIGALAGVINLGLSNFLDQITAARYGKTGGYLLIAPQHHLIVTATDKSRIMQPVPAPGVNLMNDRYMQGFNGFGIALNAAGIEELSAAQRVPAAGWFLVAVLPTAEAFAPIHELRENMLLTTLLLTLLAGTLTWWVLRRELAPMLTMARTLASQAETKSLPQPLPLTRQYETDQLVSGFNRLMQTLAQREVALMQSSSRVHAILDAALDAFIAMDAQGKITDWNDRAETVFGWTRNEALGRSLDETIIPAPHREAHRHGLARFLTTGEERILNRRVEITALHRNGEEFPVELVILPIKTGGNIEFTAFISDITHRKQSEEALKKSEEMHRLLVENSHDVIYTLTTAGVITFVSPAWTARRGHPVNQVLGQTFLRFIHPEDVAVCETVMQKMTATGQPQEGIEYRVRHLDGHWHWYHSNAVPVRDASGKVIGLQGSDMDVTENKLATKALRKSEQRYRIMFNSAPEGVWMVGPDRRTIEVNQKICDLLGLAREDLLGRMPMELADEENGKILEWNAHIFPNRQTRIYEVALRHRDGQNIPTQFSATHLFNDDGSVLGALAFVADLTERKAAQEQIQNLVFSDTLTGLPNRRLLLDRLEQALTAGARHQRQGALLVIDLDNFRTVNDTLGHDLGDLLLQQVAQRLVTCMREGDTVARAGGDEFVVLLEDLSHDPQEAATQAEAVGKKIILALNQPYQLDGHAQRNTASIGITLFGCAQRESVVEPLKRAELAMYQAKAAGRSTLRFYEAQMQVAVMRRAALEASLRAAIALNQFILHYQAQVNHEGNITGVEALVRWLDPLRGMVSPAEFIPLAEETNLILPLGQWVLETACAQLVLWAKQPAMAHLTMAVNVSVRQFHHKDFVVQVLAALDNTGANPKRLKLELTESLLVSDVEDVIAKMSALKGVGVSFSLDDFGTGYSSLSYLKRLPLDQLKIDQCFVREILVDANDAAIARMIIALAQSLGLAVIAEGVETEAQRDFLAGLGCHAYQGYLFSRPLPLAGFEALAKRV